MSENDWNEIEANEIRVWLGEPATGLWCPKCLLPSGYGLPISRDPAFPPSSWVRRCSVDSTHRIPEATP